VTDPVRPVSGSDRAPAPVEPTRLTSLQREEERKRRERERERRRKGAPKPPRDGAGGIDVRA
jgi:hypothetical protein